MKLSIKDIKGNEQGEVSLSFQPVEAEKGSQAVHDVVVAYMAAQRMGTASTKTMGEVAGSGKSPGARREPAALELALSLRLCGGAVV